MNTAEHERAKYEQIWAVPAYRKGSPGVVHTPMFASIADPQPGESVIDLGCGAGDGGEQLAEKLGLSVTYLDHVRVAGVPDPFIKQALWDPLPARNPPWKYGYCCDVMEHIPTEYTMLVLRNIMDACESVFFSIYFQNDVFGPKLIGEPLHLTVMPYTWWRDRLAEFGELVEARDLLGEGVFYVRCRR